MKLSSRFSSPTAKRFKMMRLLLPVLGGIGLGFTVGGLNAATVTWSGGGTPGTGIGANKYSWSDSANWTGGLPSSANDLVFGSAANSATYLNGDKDARSLTFNTGSPNYSIESINVSGQTGVLYVFGANAITNNGGTQTFATGVRLRDNAAGATRTILNSGTINFNGGIMYHVTDASPASTAAVFDGTGTTRITRFERRGGNYNMSVVKNGTGSLIITAASAVPVSSQSGRTTGGYTVNAGTLQVGENNTGSIIQNDIIVNVAGTLAGLGSILSDDTAGTPAAPNTTTIFGKLAAGGNLGAGIGTLTFGTNLVLKSGSSTVFQLTSRDTQITSIAQLATLTDPALTGTHDFINIAPTANNAAVNFTIESGAGIVLDFTGYTPVWGDVFDLFDFTAGATGPTVVPNFTVTGGSLGAFTLDTSRFLDLGVVAIVPEPGRAMFLGLGVMLLAFRRKRAGC